MGWGPVLGYERLERVGKRRYVGVKGYYVDKDTSLQNVMDSLYGQAHPEITTDYAPICTRVQVAPPMPTKRIVLAHFETPRIVGHGELIWMPGTFARERDIDLLGNRIHGVDRDTGNRFEVVRGPRAFPETNGTFILKTAYPPGDAALENIRSRRDKINHAAMINFLNAPAFTLRYGTAHIKPHDPSGLIYVDHLFTYDPRGWNNMMFVQESAYKVVAEPVLQDDGTIALDSQQQPKTRPLGRWVPGQRLVTSGTEFDGNGNVIPIRTYEDRDPEPRSGYISTNFGDLDAIVVW